MARAPSPTGGPPGEGAAPAGRPVPLAAVTGAHGVAGEVRLKLLGEGIDSIRGHASFNDGALTLKKLRDDGKGGAVARFAEIGDRNAAEALRGTMLTVPRAALPPLAEGEFYFSDLIDLAVKDDTGAPVGRVCAVENFGATDIVEIEKPDGKRFMVPLVPHAVLRWDEHQMVIAGEFRD